MKSIIELAREAGLGSSLTHNGGEPRVWIEGADWHNELTHFAALVRAAALEEAAKVAESFATDLSKWPDAPNGETAETKFVRGIGDAMSPIPAAIRQLKEAK